MLIDLQLHSTYSDGYLTPSELAKFIAGQGVKVASLTDHNTVGGIDEFRRACHKYDIQPITGLELYVKFHHWRFNLLWYNYNETDAGLHDMLRDSQLRRRRQVRIALQKLVTRKFKLEPNKILDKYNHYAPINHIVDDFLSNPYNIKRAKKELELKELGEGEIIREYFKNANYGKLKNSYIDYDRIINLRKHIGGQLVLCHPAKYGGSKNELIKELNRLGLDGLEKSSPHHSYGSTMRIQRLARELKLIETGGSDFHRFEGGGYPIQYSWQYYSIDSKLLKGVNKIIRP